MTARPAATETADITPTKPTGPLGRRATLNPSNPETKITALANDIRQYAMAGLYRHFSASGELLYVGETENFLARTAIHMQGALWKDEIHTIELEPMPKAAARKLEPKIITAELPLYNITHRPRAKVLRAQQKKERFTAQWREWQATVRQQVIERQAAEERQAIERQAAEERALAHKAALEKRHGEQRLALRDQSERDFAKALKKQRAPWNGELETYRGIYDERNVLHVGRGATT